MTFTKAKLPSAVKVGGRWHRIHSDFRRAIILQQRIRENVALEEIDFMYIDGPPADRAAGFRELLAWLNPPRELPRPSRVSSSETLLDYEADAPLIFAAFWEVYGIDLFDPALGLHWHKFLALLSGLHDTKLNEVQGYRSYRPRKGDPPEYRREMIRLKEMWRLEERLSAEEEAALAKFQSQLRGC